MKIRRIFVSGAAVCLFSAATVCGVLATSTFAQAPNSQAEGYFQQYLAANPELQKNPGLMSNPQWLNAHPSFHSFLEEHPNVAAQAHEMSGSQGEYGRHEYNSNQPHQNPSMGAYDQRHERHNSNWSAANRREWIQQHRQD
jgi:hypothetical protein